MSWIIYRRGGLGRPAAPALEVSWDNKVVDKTIVILKQIPRDVTAKGVLTGVTNISGLPRERIVVEIYHERVFLNFRNSEDADIVRMAIDQRHGRLHFPGRLAASLVRMYEYKRNPGDRRTGETAFENRRREEQRELERQRREVVPATRDSPQMREPDLLSAATSPATTAPSLFATPADVHPNLPVVVAPSSDDSVVDSSSTATEESSKNHEAEVSCEAPVIAPSHAPAQVSTAAGVPVFHPQPIGAAPGPAQWAIAEYGRGNYPCLVPGCSECRKLAGQTFNGRARVCSDTFRTI